MTIIEQAAKAARIAYGRCGSMGEWDEMLGNERQSWIAAVEAALGVWQAHQLALSFDVPQFLDIVKGCEQVEKDKQLFAKAREMGMSKLSFQMATGIDLLDPGDEQPEEDVQPIVIGGEG